MTRAELYALIWQEPLAHAAKRFGISSARLRKICIDYNVPMPSAGYWVKRAHGKEVDRPSLPPLQPTVLGKVNAALRRIGEIPLQLADTQIADFSLGLVSDPTQPDEPDPCAGMARDALNRSDVDPDGFIIVDQLHLPHIRIGPASIERAVGLIDALAKALSLRGFSLVRSEEGLCIDVEGELLTFRIYETRRKAAGGTEMEPSGRLCLEIFDSRAFRWSSRNLVGQWYDRTNRPVEGAIDDVLATLAPAASTIRHCRAKVEERRRLDDDEAQRRQDQAQRSNRKLRRRKFLDDKAGVLTRMEELNRLLVLVSSQPRAGEDSIVRGLVRELREMIAELQAQLEIGSLSTEARRHQLLQEDD